MTKKDFQLIADILREYNESADSFGKKLQIQSIIGKFADILAANNPRFDVIKFKHACGPIVLVAPESSNFAKVCKGNKFDVIKFGSHQTMPPRKA